MDYNQLALSSFIMRRGDNLLVLKIGVAIVNMIIMAYEKHAKWMEHKTLSSMISPS